MPRKDFGSASAVAQKDLRPMSTSEVRVLQEDRQALTAWRDSGDEGRPPPRRVHSLGDGFVDGPEHGVEEESTWCGIPLDEVLIMRHTFRPTATFACGRCAERFLAFVDERSLTWS